MPRRYSVFFMSLSRRRVSFLAMFALCFSLTLMHSGHTTRQTFSAFSFSEFFNVLLGLTLMECTVSPPHVHCTTTLTTNGFYPASTFLMVRVIFIIRVGSIHVFWCSFFQGFYNVYRPIFRYFLSTRRFSVFFIGSNGNHGVVLMLMSMLPPTHLMMCEYFCLTRFLCFFRVLHTLRSVFFFRLLPYGDFFSPCPVPISAVFLRFLPYPLLYF